jgi:phenylalanine-4-hydroxylase
MEFQAYNVLVIASDIEQLEHIEYPAPDIIMKELVTLP